MIHHPEDEQLRQIFRQAPWRSQTQATSLVLAVVVLVAVIGALYLAQASATAATGRRLQALEAQRQALEQQNAQLRAEIASLRSVPRLMGDAERLGYRPATAHDVEYLLVQDVPPLPPPTPTPPLTAEQVVPRYSETLEGWLSEQLASFRVQFGDFWRRTFGRPRGEGETPEETPGTGGEPTATPQPAEEASA